VEVIYRQGKKDDCSELAELVNIAAIGIIPFLYDGLVPDLNPIQIIADDLADENSPHSYESAIVAEYNEKVVGVAVSLPSKFHMITEKMKNFFPPERLAHLKHFFSARVENSLLLESLGVNEDFRNKGIGTKLISLTKKKAKESDFNLLSLLVLADNKAAQRLYKHCGFEVEKNVELKYHEHIPHEGGCVLMKCSL